MLQDVGQGLSQAFFMFWETLWALVLGFALSGAVQAIVSRGEMRRAMGDHKPVTVARTSFLGVISSSCSYASSALAKSLFARGADFTASMVFMLASTNLVVELGIVLWLLIGWQFALAELVGGAVMIVLLGLVVPRLVPPRMVDAARERLNLNEPPRGDSDETSAELPPWRQRLRSRAGWRDAAGYMMSDLRMVRKELVAGFLVAGFLSALVPATFWQSLFLTGHGFWSSLENVVLGPFLAIISFVCSVGNVPLAAALWQGGISFGGVVSFVFADLITLPLLLIYRKYFGSAITLRILLIFWATMSTAGLVVEYIFRALRIPDPSRPMTIAPGGFAWDHTAVLNMIALVVFAGLFWLHHRRAAGNGPRFASDPVCGMQVEKAHAPATTVVAGQRFWFCSDRCLFRFQEAGTTAVPRGYDDLAAQPSHGGP